jgi:hypothetical protein
VTGPLAEAHHADGREALAALDRMAGQDHRQPDGRGSVFLGEMMAAE